MLVDLIAFIPSDPTEVISLLLLLPLSAFGDCVSQLLPDGEREKTQSY